MIQDIPKKRLYSSVAHKKFGLPNGYGEAIYGMSLYGDWNDFSAIYRSRVVDGKREYQKIKFYPYVVTNTSGQIVGRSKFRNAVSSWQALSSDEKNRFKLLAVGKKMSGYNYFIRRFMMA